MKTIYIVGEGAFARECYFHLTKLMKHGDIKFGGFLGHGGYGHTVDYKNFQHLYLGEVTEHEFKDDEYCIIGAGYPDIRKKIYYDLKKMNVKFYTLIGEDIEIHETVKYGEANIFVSPLRTTVNIEIGNCNVFNGGVIIGHDLCMGDLNFVGPNTIITGHVSIGNENQIGTNTIFLPKSKIGNNNKIAPLSVIYKGCKNNCYMQGNPAFKVGHVKI